MGHAEHCMCITANLFLAGLRRLCVARPVPSSQVEFCFVRGESLPRKSLSLVGPSRLVSSALFLVTASFFLAGLTRLGFSWQVASAFSLCVGACKSFSVVSTRRARVATRLENQ